MKLRAWRHKFPLFLIEFFFYKIKAELNYQLDTPGSCGRRPSSRSDRAEPSDPRCQTEKKINKWSVVVKRSGPRTIIPLVSWRRWSCFLYLHVDAVFKAALGLRLHEPAGENGRACRFRNLPGFCIRSCSFPLPASCRGFLGIDDFACNVQLLIKK